MNYAKIEVNGRVWFATLLHDDGFWSNHILFIHKVGQNISYSLLKFNEKELKFYTKSESEDFVKTMLDKKINVVLDEPLLYRNILDLNLYLYNYPNIVHEILP